MEEKNRLDRVIKMELQYGEDDVKIYQVQVPEKVIENYISMQVDNNGMITIYWCDSSKQTIAKERT